MKFKVSIVTIMVEVGGIGVGTSSSPHSPNAVAKLDFRELLTSNLGR